MADNDIKEFIRKYGTGEILKHIRWTDNHLHTVIGKAKKITDTNFWAEVDKNRREKKRKALEGAEEAARKKKKEKIRKEMKEIGCKYISLDEDEDNNPE